MTERQLCWPGKRLCRVRKENVSELGPLSQSPRKMVLAKLRAGEGGPALTWRQEQNLQTVSVSHEAPSPGEQIGLYEARTDP